MSYRGPYSREVVAENLGPAQNHVSQSDRRMRCCLRLGAPRYRTTAISTVQQLGYYPQRPWCVECGSDAVARDAWARASTKKRHFSSFLERVETVAIVVVRRMLPGPTSRYYLQARFPIDFGQYHLVH